MKQSPDVLFPAPLYLESAVQKHVGVSVLMCMHIYMYIVRNNYKKGNLLD